MSSVLGVALCISNNPVVFLLLRMAQGAMLAGVLLASYISSKVTDPIFTSTSLLGSQILYLIHCFVFDQDSDPTALVRSHILY